MYLLENSERIFIKRLKASVTINFLLLGREKSIQHIENMLKSL